MKQKFRILAVDDEEDVLDLLIQMLEPEYEVLTAFSAEAALDILGRQSVDMLITDQRMPRMSGIELIERAKKLNPGMVRILLTAYSDPEEVMAAINRGEVYRYITKPWDINDLLLTIRHGLEAYQLRRDKERLLRDQRLRLNAMTVFLDLIREASQSRTYTDILSALVKYLPFIVDFDVCTSVLETRDGAKVLLNIHARRQVHEKLLFEARAATLSLYQSLGKGGIRDEDVLIHLSGERLYTEEAPSPLCSSVHVVLKPGGEQSGMIQLFSTKKDAFQEDTEQLLYILANHTSEIILLVRRQLREEQQRLELMVQSLADGVIMVDDQDQVFVINPAARALLHLSPDTPVNARYLKDTLGFYPFDLVRGWSARKGAILREEIRVFDRVLHSIVSPVVLGEKLIGVAVVLRDISEEKRLEERKEEFVSIVSHELRTPLTSISGALDLLLRRYVGEINSKQERYLQLAKGSCDKLNMTIDELLDLSRFAKGKMEMEMAPLDLVSLAAEAVENFQAAAQDRGVLLQRILPGGEVLVHGDRHRLHQVLNNLLSNALKFTSDGGTTRVELFEAAALPGMVAVSVHNDGEEIDEQDHERIFDKFEQAHRQRGGAVAGSGLGLSICKNIIEAHGGRIWVESGRGNGTQFIFTLPRGEAGGQSPAVALEGAEAPAAQGSTPESKLPPRVLLFDEDRKSALMLKGWMMAHGFSLIVADSDKEALRLARERRPDLIALDLKNSESDGLRVADILHHDPETREIPVLVISEPLREGDAFKVGASAFLTKPLAADELISTVERLLSARCVLKRMFKVLIVDDDPSIRSVCREVLERQGYAVLEAQSGKEALDRLQKNTVDLVLLDIMLPDFDGFYVTEKIRTNRSTADVSIIFISARGQTFDKVRALRLGADDYMVKPFDAVELGARVDAVLKRKERELDSSPTTKLPGSVALERELNRRLAAGAPFVLCYLDLDNLKAFNDCYGYAKADGVIQQTGDLIRKAVENKGTPTDFVGHIAGDDFVLVTTADRVQAVGNEIITNFDKIIPLYYRQEDQQRGYIVAEDRFGEVRRFPIMSISLAAVNVQPGRFRSPAEIASQAAAVKKKAKAIEGSVLVEEGKAEEPPTT